MGAIYSQARFVLLSFTCQRPKLVPVICNASDIYSVGLLGTDWSGPRVKGHRKSQEDRWKGDEAVSAEGERNDRSCGSDRMMGRKRGKGQRFHLLGSDQGRLDWTDEWSRIQSDNQT